MNVFIVVEKGLELDRFCEREHAEQFIMDLILDGRWDAYAARYQPFPVWVEMVRL